MKLFVRGLLLTAAIPLFTACFPQVSEELTETEDIELTSYQQTMYGTTPVIIFRGTCPTNTNNLYFAIDASKTSQMGAMAGTSKGSMASQKGQAFGKCENGKLTATYIVPNSTSSSTFTFKTRGSVRSGGLTKFASMTVVYAPVAPSPPGFAAVSGGGRIVHIGNDIMLQGTIGQPVNSYILDGAPNDVSARVNLQGIIAE